MVEGLTGRTAREEGGEEAIQTAGYWTQRDTYSHIHVSGCPGSLERRSPRGCAATVRHLNVNFFGLIEMLWSVDHTVRLTGGGCCGLWYCSP